MHQSFSTHLIPIHSFRPKALCVGDEGEALLAFLSEMFQNGTQVMFYYVVLISWRGHNRLAILASR